VRTPFLKLSQEFLNQKYLKDKIALIKHENKKEI